jgi:rhamnosyltransferase
VPITKRSTCRGCLEGIRQQTVKDVEVILVDSGSTDATLSIAESYGAQVVRIPSAEFTFGRSLNFGVRAARRGLVVIASAHVYPVYPDWLECLLRPFDDEQVALVYGKQRGMGHVQVLRAPDLPPVVPRCGCDAAGQSVLQQCQCGHPAFALGGPSLRRDPDRPGRLAWAKWAQDAGYGVSYAAHAEVVHIHNETPRGVYNRYRREAMAFKRIFPESHFNVYDFARLTATNILSDLFHAARKRIFWRHFVSVFWFRYNQFRGTYQGYRQSGPVTQQLRQTFYYPHWSAGKTDERDVEPIRYNR